MTPAEWFYFLLVVAGSLVVGFWTQNRLIRTLHQKAASTRWRWDDVVISSLRGLPVIWIVCAGVYGAISFSRFDEQFGRYGPKVVAMSETIMLVVVFATTTFLAARLAAGLIDSLASRAEGGLHATTLISTGIRYVIFGIGFLILLHVLGIDITPVWAGLGISGIAIALALEDTLSNLLSGVLIVFSRQVRPGDYVKLNSGEEGYVTDVKGRNTTILSFPDNNMVIIPNAAMASSVVTNYNLPRKNMWLKIHVGVSYDSDLEHVENVVLQVAKDVLASVEGGVPAKDPVLFYQDFSDSSIDFMVRLYIREFSSQFRIKHEFIKRLHRCFGREGIEIPFPIRTVHMRSTGQNGA